MNDIETKKEETDDTPKVKKPKIKLFVLLGAIVIAGLIYLAVAIFGIGGGGVVATVNGENILKSELEQRFNQDKQRAISQGVDTSNSEVAEQVKSRILQDLINNKLLLQAASKSNIEIDSDTVDSEIALIEQQIGGEEALLAQLSEVGIDEDEFREEVLNQLILQKYLLENIDTTSITATDEEISLAYKQASATSENIPALSEIEKQIRNQVVIGKQQKLINTRCCGLHMWIKNPESSLRSEHTNV